MSACVAGLSVSRLVKGNDCRVNVHHKSGRLVLSIPLIDYALLVKGSVGRPLDDQNSSTVRTNTTSCSSSTKADAG